MRHHLIRAFLMNAAPGEAPTGAGAPPPPANGAPANGAPPAPAPAPPEKGGAKDAVEQITLPKDAFDERLKKAGDAAARKLLKDLGFEKAEDATAALSTLKKLQDEQLTDLDRHKKRVKELEPLEAEAKEYRGIVEKMVEERFKTLPDSVQQLIDEEAKGDPRARLRHIKLLEAAGAIKGAGAPPAPPAPANKAPAGAPPPAPNGGPKSKYDEWLEMKDTNPSRASVFYQIHAPAIEASRPADS